MPGVTSSTTRADGYPTALDAAGRDEVFVGRIRRDPSHERGLQHVGRLRQPAQGRRDNAVQIAELLASAACSAGGTRAAAVTNFRLRPLTGQAPDREPVFVAAEPAEVRYRRNAACPYVTSVTARRRARADDARALRAALMRR